MGRLGEEGKEECIIIQGGSLGSKCVGVSFSIHRALLQCMTTLFSGWTLELFGGRTKKVCLSWCCGTRSIKPLAACKYPLRLIPKCFTFTVHEAVSHTSSFEPTTLWEITICIDRWGKREECLNFLSTWPVRGCSKAIQAPRIATTVCKGLHQVL